MKKKKTGLDYVKAYNRKIKKTKSPLTYVPINIEAYLELTPAEKGQITKLIKKFDLRKERRLAGSDVSLNTRDLLKYMEKLSNKRIVEFKDKFENVTLKSQGQELPKQAAEVYKSEAPLTTDINVKKLKPREILRKGESFQKHFMKSFYDESLERMKKNYIDTLLFMFGVTGYDGDVEGLIKYLKDLPLDKFYEIYLENVDMHIVFDISPNTRKKVQIEHPMPEGDAVYEAVSVGSGYAETVREDLIVDLKQTLRGSNIDTNQLVSEIQNLDIVAFFEEYLNDNFEIDYGNPVNTFNTIQKGVAYAQKKKR